mgnify:CR=1 FL=1|jgi:hypothetical protein
MVEGSSPEIIAQAIGGHSVEDESASGSSPATVVAVVSRIGRVRRATPSVPSNSKALVLYTIGMLTESMRLDL